MLEVNDYVSINMDNRNCIGIGIVSRIVNKTILTKERYMANCYKVGGEDE